MIINRNYCSRCKTTENLVIHYKTINKNGDTVIYYMCAEHILEKRAASARINTFNKESGKVIHKKYCATCKTTENIYENKSYININGNKIQYYSCNICNTKRHLNWYHNGNQKRAMQLNKIYLERKLQEDKLIGSGNLID